MTAFHGFRAVDNNDIHNLNGWRVDGRDPDGGWGNTARTVIRCPYDNSEQRLNGQGRSHTVTRMLAGYDIYDPHDRLLTGNDRAGVLAFRHFINDLWRQGYLNTAALMPLMRDSGMHLHDVTQRGEMPVAANGWGLRRPADNAYNGVDIWHAPCRPYHTPHPLSHILIVS
jgi:hypothetical protein